MDDTMLIVKYVEVMIMQVLVLAAVVALLIAALRDIVEAKVKEARRRDQIAPAPNAKDRIPQQPAIQEPTIAHHARL